MRVGVGASGALLSSRSAEERRQRDATEEAEPGGPPDQAPAEGSEMQSAIMDGHPVEREDGSNSEHTEGAQDQGAPLAGQRLPSSAVARFTLTRSWAPQVRSSVTEGSPTRWTRTRAFFPPAVV